MHLAVDAYTYIHVHIHPILYLLAPCLGLSRTSRRVPTLRRVIASRLTATPRRHAIQLYDDVHPFEVICQVGVVLLLPQPLLFLLLLMLLVLMLLLPPVYLASLCITGGGCCLLLLWLIASFTERRASRRSFSFFLPQSVSVDPFPSLSYSFSFRVLLRFFVC